MTTSAPRSKSGLLAICAAAILTACAADQDLGEEAEPAAELAAEDIAQADQPIVAASSTPDYLRCSCRDEATGETSEGQLCAATSCASGSALNAACAAVCGTKTVTGAACFDDSPRCTQSSNGAPNLSTLSGTPNVLECTCGDGSTPQAAVGSAECASRSAETSACNTLCGGRGSARAARCVRGTKRLAAAPQPRFGFVTWDSAAGGYVGDRSYSSRNLQVNCTCLDGRRDVVCAPSDTSNGSTWTLNANSCSNNGFVRDTCGEACGGSRNVLTSSCTSSSGKYNWLFTFSTWAEGNDLCLWGVPKPNLVECTCGTRNFRTCAEIKASAVASGNERNLLNSQLRDVCTPICAGFGGYVPNAYVAQETYSSFCTYSHM